ncbi:MAG TPA: 4Fe-4S dicluster domain-containing protein [Thermoplasmata archaeon]|nr:4Fe-4S dicluster domain-containing protein [Thermoplasmata archaeon]
MAAVRRYGAFDVSACFSCGTCTVSCPLSTPTSNFPRKMIHYAPLGLKDKIVGRPDVWLCESCGECSDTCPRDAKPSIGGRIPSDPTYGTLRSVHLAEGLSAQIRLPGMPIAESAVTHPLPDGRAVLLELRREELVHGLRHPGCRDRRRRELPDDRHPGPRPLGRVEEEELRTCERALEHLVSQADGREGRPAHGEVRRLASEVLLPGVTARARGDLLPAHAPVAVRIGMRLTRAEELPDYIERGVVDAALVPDEDHARTRRAAGIRFAPRAADAATGHSARSPDRTDQAPRSRRSSNRS